MAFGILDGFTPHSSGVQVIASNDTAGRHEDGAWNFYAGVVETAASGSTLRLYRNGVEVASQSFPTLYPNPGSCRFYIGDRIDGNTCNGTTADEFANLSGAVDDVRIYDRALTAGEIMLLMNEPPTSNVVP